MKKTTVLLSILSLFFLISCEQLVGPIPDKPVNTDNPVNYRGNGHTGGTVPVDNTKYLTGDPVTVLDPGTLSKTGHDFTRWNTASDDSGAPYNPTDTFAMPADKVILYAIWTPKSYTVSFDPNGGSAAVPATLSVTYTQAYGTLASTSQPGYTFAGWWTTPSGVGLQVSDVTLVNTAGDHSLYARWTPNTYTVTFDPEAGDTPSPTTRLVTFAALYGSLSTTSRAGWYFAGWWTGAGGTGSQVFETTAVTTPNDHVLYAKWSAVPTYTVVYNGNGNTGGTVPNDSTNYETGNTVTVQGIGTLVKTGYTLTHWGTLAGGGTLYTPGSGSFAMGSANVNLYAQWTPNTYTVTFNAQGGSGPAPATKDVTYDSAYGTLASTTRAGYTFGGWWTGPGGTGSEVIDTTILSNASDHELHAHWVPVTYSITFDKNDVNAGGIMSNQLIANGATQNLNTNVYTNPGYAFAGWATTPAGAVVYLNEAPYTMGPANVTLYAKWVPTYTVTYLPNYPGGTTGGTVPVDANTYDNGNPVTVLGNTGSLTTDLTQDGITLVFQGWNTNAAGSGTSYAPGATFNMGAGNVELYAQWGVIGAAGPAGGLIFYDSGNTLPGWRYLELAPSSTTASTYAWGKSGQLAGANGLTVGSGKRNSLLIDAFLSLPTAETGRAAQACESLSYGGFSDWFLPSRDELLLVYDNLASKGLGGFAGAGYWTSSEFSATNPYYILFSDGTAWNNNLKNAGLGTRSIRAFRTWSEPTYIVLYHGNGNTGGMAPVDTFHYHSSQSSNAANNSGGLTKAGFTFLGWNTMPDGSGTSYLPGASIPMTNNIVLYANWHDPLSPYNRDDIVLQGPNMSNASIDNSDGNRIPLGSVIFYQTSGGYYGKMVNIDSASNEGWVINFVTYENDGTILTQGINVTIPGSFEHDLDLDSLNDFQLRNTTLSIRDFWPRNGGVFYIIP